MPGLLGFHSDKVYFRLSLQDLRRMLGRLHVILIQTFVHHSLEGGKDGVILILIVLSRAPV